MKCTPPWCAICTQIDDQLGIGAALLITIIPRIIFE